MVVGIISFECKHIFCCIEYKKDYIVCVCYILLPFNIKSWQDFLFFFKMCKTMDGPSMPLFSQKIACTKPYGPFLWAIYRMEGKYEEVWKE
jgi:hypothetical protein